MEIERHISLLAHAEPSVRFPALLSRNLLVNIYSWLFVEFSGDSVVVWWRDNQVSGDVSAVGRCISPDDDEFGIPVTGHWCRSCTIYWEYGFGGNAGD